MGCRHKSKHKPRHHTHALKNGAVMMGLILKPAGETAAPTTLAPAKPSAVASGAETNPAAQPSA